MKNLINLINNFFTIHHIKRIEFRDDINGLRAVAVLAVIFYHAELDIFKGGWLGVDVFFVISGFLISNIIISELNNNSFTFKRFYIRRIRRILPALFFTLLLTIPFAFLLLTPRSFIEYSQSLIASVFFYANYFFQNLDFYNSDPVKFMPLLHTWSLAVEEQFYIIFPVVVYFLYKFFKNYFGQLIFLIFLFSLYLNSTTAEFIKFYQLHFRAWELLAGVLVMILSYNIKLKNFSLLGLFLISFSIIYFDDNFANSIEPKLISVLGVCLILLANDEKSTVYKVLSNKAFFLIGLSSFSMYLLHQPIFAFYRIERLLMQEVTDISRIRDSLFVFEKFILIVLIFIISFIFYYQIEIKFIKNFTLLKKSFLLSSVFLLTIFSLNSENLANNQNGVVSNKIYDYTVNLDAYTAKKTSPTKTVYCHNANFENLCVFNDFQSSNIVLLGDSHARELGYFLSREVKGHKLHIITGNSCLYIYQQPYHTKCPLRNDDKLEIDKYLESFNNSIFVYVGDVIDEEYYQHFNQVLLKELPKTFNFLIKNENYLIVVDQIPNFPFDPTKMLTVGGSNTIAVDSLYWYDKENVKTYLELYNNYRGKNYYRINSDKYFCNSFVKDKCVAAIDNRLFYRDDNHLTIEGVEIIGKEILDLIDKIKQQ